MSERDDGPKWMGKLTHKEKWGPLLYQAVAELSAKAASLNTGKEE